MRKVLLIFCLVTFAPLSTSAQVLVIGWNVPIHAPAGGCPGGGGGDPFYCDFQANVLPWIDGVSLQLNWEQSGIDATTCVTGGNCTVAYSSLQFSNFDTNILSQYYNATCGASLRGGGGHPCVVNIVVNHVSNQSPNTTTPAYIFQQEWANTPGVAPGWQSSNLYYTNAVISANGKFWTETGGSSVGYCTSGTIEPVFTGASVSDGTCTWTLPSLDAAPQDVAVCGTGTGGYQGSGMTVPGEYNVANSSYTATTLATGFPAVWENPYQAAINGFDSYVIYHYSLSSLSWKSQIAYVRLGISLGNEVSTVCGAQLQVLMVPASNSQMKLLWTGSAASSYAYYAAQRETQPSVGPWYLMTSINCSNGNPGGNDCTWAQAEAAAALAQPGYTFGSQGLKTADLSGIQFGASCTGTNCCSNNWCNARNTATGSVPYIELQDCNNSTAAGGTSGCLGDTSTPERTLSEVFALATQHGVNALEIYANDLLCAFDQTTYYAAQTPANTCTTIVSAGYQSALQNLAVGQPSGTSMLSGNAQISGYTGGGGLLQ